MTPSAVDALRREIFLEAPGLEVAERLFDGVDDVVFCIKNRAGMYVAVNRAFAERLGLRARSDLLGRTAAEVFSPALAAGYEQQDREVLSGGCEVRDKLEMVLNREGKPGWFIARKTPIRNRHGEIIGVAGVSRDLHIPASGDPRLGAIGRVIDRIRAAFSEPLRIEELAAEAGLTTAQLERGMKRILHVSARQFLTRIRLEAAAEALRDFRRPIVGIATDCGFYDQSTLTRQFRAATGFSPGAYRAACRASGWLPV